MDLGKTDDERLRSLAYFIERYFHALDAKRQLDAGFNGMGHNILTESAGGLRSAERKLREAYELLSLLPEARWLAEQQAEKEKP